MFVFHVLEEYTRRDYDPFRRPEQGPDFFFLLVLFCLHRLAVHPILCPHPPRMKSASVRRNEWGGREGTRSVTRLKYAILIDLVNPCSDCGHYLVLDG